MAEKELREKRREGNRNAQRELYRRYSPVLFGICLRYSPDRDTAQDILQDTFLKIFSSIGDYAGAGSFEGWMKRIAINTAITNYHQSLKHMHHEDVDDYAQSLQSGEPNLDQQEFTRDELLGVVNSLPDGYRMVFNMFAVEGFKHREIAEMLGIDINTSKTQFMRARNLVIRKLNELRKF
ncbi:MAG: RNA polymerase sigma factor [Bacteroidales bacterium]|nr:RNA polymerase sigma factor [Bacteroidales bacterium]